MPKIKFEHTITFAYLTIGSLWILFSDMLVERLFPYSGLLTQIQTYKGWFYVLVTAIIFYFFLKEHLSKLRTTEAALKKHQENLTELVQERTKELDATIEELRAANEELNAKNETISKQNNQLSKALNELNATRDQLIHAEKMASLSTLTSGIAHEINNPLNFIAGGLTGLEKYFAKTDVEQEKNINLFLSSIKTGMQKTEKIVSAMHQLNRQNSKYTDQCNINEIIMNCIEILQTSNTHHVSFETKLCDKTPIIRGNIGELHQVFVNIITNAIQSITNEGSINISTFAKETTVEIAIKDTGCGIPQDILTKITDPFFTTKTPQEGVGLGLSVADNIIRSHQGQLTISSEINKGTTVIVTLPKKYKND